MALINMAFELADSDILKPVPASETEGMRTSNGSGELSLKDAASNTGSLNAPALEDQITRLQVSFYRTSFFIAGMLVVVYA